MKETIYLVGQISPKYEESYQWRKNVRERLGSDPNIDIIDPCCNPFNKRVLEEKSYAVLKTRRVNGIDVLPPKDYTYCKKSTIAIANMNQYDPGKPLLGSFFELAWYYTMPDKTVIGFASDLNDYLCQHPFVKQAVHTWCNDEQEACDIVEKYFKTVEGM
jgi:hypothetical protein